MRASTAALLVPWLRLLGELDEDEDDEPDDSERHGERDTEEHRGPGDTGRLGLAGHGRDGVANHDADTNTGTDSGQAVAETGADRRQPGEELLGLGLCQQVEHLVPPSDGG